MIKTISWIGYYGFLEAVRNRLLLGMLVLILPLLGSTWFLDSYQLGFQVKIVKDLGLNLLSGFGVLIIVVLALDQIFPDIEKKSIYFVLSRTSSRHAYIWGRFLGVVGALCFFHTIMVSFLLILLKFHDGAWFWEIAVGSCVIFLKQCLLLSFILFLTTFSSKIVVMSLGALFYVMGHSYDIIRMLFEKKESSMISMLFEAVAFFLPDFSLFELRMSVIHEIPVQLPAFLLLAAYSLSLGAVYLGLGGRILARRDL